MVSSHLRVSSKTPGALRDCGTCRHETLSVRVMWVTCAWVTAWCLQDPSAWPTSLPTPKNPQSAKVLVVLWRTAQRELGLQERREDQRKSPLTPALMACDHFATLKAKEHLQARDATGPLVEGPRARQRGQQCGLGTEGTSSARQPAHKSKGSFHLCQRRKRHYKQSSQKTAGSACAPCPGLGLHGRRRVRRRRGGVLWAKALTGPTGSFSHSTLRVSQKFSHS